jgi:molybdopterin converting factor small subunit
MNILLFGVLADVAGKRSIDMKADDMNSLKGNLLNLYPDLANYKFQFAVNREKIEGNILLNDSDEIALLPPFAGG